ncbi:pyridoxal phosphate-dependent transferase [Jimgerdemannia flammicorona]|uniref:Pyridoxal phosphate-dependent transferase n=1 Tax=Jimgerdemannia flammicorona TaxID=994334 RepID=A0A433QPX8_9FUNG|nr:pyridoxal phosphate-dependent transferase [Jimgerdemannia flammicorona]
MSSPHQIDLLAQEAAVDFRSKEFAALLDSRDELAHLRHEFCIPRRGEVLGEGAQLPVHYFVSSVRGDADEPCIYMCANSLGLMPKRTRRLIMEELDIWAKKGVEGHWNHDYKRPWVNINETVVDVSADLVGGWNGAHILCAHPSEVAIMNTLTGNLHTLMASFYVPTSERYKIICEAKAFSSDHVGGGFFFRFLCYLTTHSQPSRLMFTLFDLRPRTFLSQYAFESQIKWHGYKPADALVLVSPREGEKHLRTDDILEVIRREGSNTALVIFSGVQFYTGQWFEMETITKAGHKQFDLDLRRLKQGCMVGWDLAHAVGNVPIRLHDWDVDFACWCSYKYLNAGPGGIAGIFVHERHATDYERPRFVGWWGNDKNTRFQMNKGKCIQSSHQTTLTPSTHHKRNLHHFSPRIPTVRGRRWLHAFEPVGPQYCLSAGLTGDLRAGDNATLARQIPPTDRLPRAAARC